MEIIKGLLCNDMLVCSFVAYFVAQALKILTGFFHEGKWTPSLIWSSGGMPSSHSSTVCALTFSAARVAGVYSPVFAMCFVLASIVMYDATGVRRAAGVKQRDDFVTRHGEGVCVGDDESLLSTVSLKIFGKLFNNALAHSIIVK